jgi:hypothetical protein
LLYDDFAEQNLEHYCRNYKRWTLSCLKELVALVWNVFGCSQAQLSAAIAISRKVDLLKTFCTCGRNFQFDQWQHMIFLYKRTLSTNRKQLTLSRQMSIYNQNWYSSTMVKSRYIIECVPFTVLRSYFVHTSLGGTACYTNVSRNASSCHLEVIVCTSWEANAPQTLLRVSAKGHGFTYSHISAFSHEKMEI